MDDNGETTEQIIEGLKIAGMQNVEVALVQLIKIAEKLEETIDRFVVERIESDKVLNGLLTQLIQQARPEIVEKI